MNSVASRNFEVKKCVWVKGMAYVPRVDKLEAAFVWYAHCVYEAKKSGVSHAWWGRGRLAGSVNVAQNVAWAWLNNNMSIDGVIGNIIISRRHFVRCTPQWARRWPIFDRNIVRLASEIASMWPEGILLTQSMCYLIIYGDNQWYCIFVGISMYVMRQHAFYVIITLNLKGSQLPLREA